MVKHSYEIEIKSLLGGKETADALVAKMRKADRNLKALGSHSQLNHYFDGGNLKKLYEKMSPMLSGDYKTKLDDLSQRAKDFSVRTRQADGRVILVVKATVDDTTSENGTARIEFESTMSSPSPLAGEGDQRAGDKKQNIMTIDDLDNLILETGFSYQAKWSRERNDYKFKDLNVSIDKNAGYGYLAEFEKILEDESGATEAKQLIRDLMAELEITELPQDRLARMFHFYNKNWQDYYGTEKTFTIE
ncbi:MAG: hypothetical protein COT92_02680 [Candidatus Doudnabacteria bacterium CG10_big_fil_rev_8_21_14_0_10_42_18]|uniref:CYTH domain-containing protein n=1 Tax=Candidatus Doudnabacteria bacterium CG10_big_fil_rev_8_21_14_0_10_42_18 TaxID=1974552 RepID=A0A2H0VAK6_9BACT|nr:MAG: hypothetical protein COT92_02680 [Candidatus Doudnabacteria bacterium CG10_big_fil_rev_8_21_14_0_10_42_18]